MKEFARSLIQSIKQNSFSKSDYAIVIILSLGIFLRVWQLESKMILFADAGRDMLAAVEMNKTGEVPLLGIPSSVPRFKQGPLLIWLEALVFQMVGINPLAVGYVLAFLSSSTVLQCFLLMRKYVNSYAAVFSSLLLATSPLAVAHSRMPYHITPIIFFLILYLWSLQSVIQKKKLSVMVASLCFALLFQFELALFPLLLLIPFILFRYKFWQMKMFGEGLVGLTLGLLPQIIFDFTHRFEQLGGFGLWLGYRVVSFFWIGKSHSFSISKVANAWNIFIHYFSRIFSLDNVSVGVLFLLLLGICTYIVLIVAKKHSFLQTIVVGLTLLLLALVVHGTPSEAYFPPIILLSCLVIGAGLSLFPFKWKQLSLFAVVLISLINTKDIVQNNFFVLTNSSKFVYGPGYGEQLKIMQFIHSQSQDAEYQLRSTDPDAHFETYLDNYRIIGLSQNSKVLVKGEDPSTNVFFINSTPDIIDNYPLAKITFFEDAHVIQLPMIYE